MPYWVESHTVLATFASQSKGVSLGGFWKAATPKAEGRRKQDWIFKCLQGGRAHPLAVYVEATLCCSPPALLETEAYFCLGGSQKACLELRLVEAVLVAGLVTDVSRHTPRQLSHVRWVTLMATQVQQCV